RGSCVPSSGPLTDCADPDAAICYMTPSKLPRMDCMQGPRISPSSAPVRSPRSGVSGATALTAFVFLVASATTPGADTGRGTVLIGVLEEVPGVYSGESS